MIAQKRVSTFRQKRSLRAVLPVDCRAIILPLAACLVASCADTGAFFKLGGEPFVQSTKSPAQDSKVPPLIDERPTGNPTIDAETREVRSSAVTAIEDTSQARPEIGVGSKRGVPLAEIRQELARLLRSGAIGEVPEEHMVDDAPANARYFVQIGSHQLQSAADSQLRGARITLSSVISGLDLQVRPAGISGRGWFFRVQVGPMTSQGAALDLCRALQSQKQSCFMLAEKPPAASKPKVDTALKGEWASIALGEGRYRNHAGTPAKKEPAPRNARQLADAAPTYTFPGLPGLPD